MNTLLIIVFLLLLFSAIISAAETALFSLSSMKVKGYGHSPSHSKRLVYTLLKHPKDLLITIFFLNTLSNILLQNAASSYFDSYQSWILKVGIPLVVTLVFGEVIPKNFGLTHNEWLAEKTSAFVLFCYTLTSPIRKLILNVTNPLARILFSFFKKGRAISSEELYHALVESHKSGILSDEEVELARGYLDLQEKSVKEVMRPRDEILFYTLEEPLTKLTYIMLEEQVSKVPVCLTNIDDVFGVISAKNYYLHQEELSSPEDLRKYLIPPFFVPETIDVKTLFKQLLSSQKKIALVVDEYGSISGLITLEDIVEIVVGDIADKRDSALFSSLSEKTIVADGKMEIQDLEELFSIELDNPYNLVTVGGWLTDKLGEIPKNGLEFSLENLHFQILASDPNKIKKVHIRYLG